MKHSQVDGISILTPARLAAAALLTMLTLTTACGNPPGSPTPSTPPPTTVPSPTHTESPTAAPTSTPTPQPTPTPTRPACLDQGGQMESGTVPNSSTVWPLHYLVYLPPCYSQPPEVDYPTLYLLHGMTYTEQQWVDLGIVETADALISQGEMPPLLIVMPRWENRRGVDQVVAETVAPFIAAQYRTREGREWRAIGGISRGAGWAYRTAFKFPQFGAIGLHSPAVPLAEMFALSDWIQTLPPESITRIWIDAGLGDSLLPTARNLAETLDNLELPYQWSTPPGGHNNEYWSSRLEEYLRWYASPWLPDSTLAETPEP